MPKDLIVRVVSHSANDRPLLLDADPMRLAGLHMGLRDAGIDVVPVRYIAEIERWPANTVVITDIDRFTPWWREVGATGVIVLADTREQGVAACRSGATRWLPHNCTVPQLLEAISSALLPETHVYSTTVKVQGRQRETP